MSSIWEQSFCTIATHTQVAKMGVITQIEGVWRFVYECGHFPERKALFYSGFSWSFAVFHIILITCISNPDVNQHHLMISELFKLLYDLSPVQYFIIFELSLASVSKGQK